RLFEDIVAELRSTGARVVVFTGFDTQSQPVMRHLRGKIATYNMHLRAIADRYDCDVVDLWSMRFFQDARAWNWDRLHLSPEGHRRVGLRVAEILGVPVTEDWNEPWPPPEPRDWRTARQEDLHWAREFLVPWIGRRLTGRSSGDNVLTKRPTLQRCEARPPHRHLGVREVLDGGRARTEIRSAACRTTAGADTEDLHGVGDAGEPVFGAHLCGPLLHGGFFHLDRRGAGTAHQVMVVFLCGAGSVDGLSRVGAQDIDLTGVAQGL